MSYEIAPLKSYVRFYLAIQSQLERVWSSLVAIETAVREELGPFAPDLGPVPLTAIATLVDPVRALPPDMGELWHPQDAAELDGLCDVYEVVGRFSFQGEGDANLQRVARLVAVARAAIEENDVALRALAPLRDLARTTAEELRASESSRAAALRSERSDKLEPLIETVLLRAKQTQDALHAVPIPPLDDAQTAADEYKKLRARLQQVYQTCLPFLKNAIAQVWGFIGAPVPQDFPEELPLVAELPPEMLSLSVAGSEELEKAERTLEALASEGQGLRKAKDDIAARLTKLESELAGFQLKREDHGRDVDFAHTLLDWARTSELATLLKGRAEELERELKARVAYSTEGALQVAALKSQLDEETEAFVSQSAALDVMLAELEELKKKEPLLFGKDDWRAKVAASTATLETERAAVAQLGQAQAQRRVELSAAEIRTSTAQAEQAIVERSLADVRGRRTEAEKSIRALSEKLGSKRPSRVVAPAEVEEIVVALEGKQSQLDAEIDRVRGEQKRFKEDGLRTIAREKQIEVERQNAQARVDGARVARAEGIDAAYKRLAVERKAAVEEHVREVLGALSKSLVQVGTVFVDPAREKLREATEPDYSRAEKVATAGEAVAPVVDRLLAERAPEIVAVQELLAKIQKEFCDAAPAACRAAWG